MASKRLLWFRDFFNTFLKKHFKTYHIAFSNNKSKYYHKVHYYSFIYLASFPSLAHCSPKNKLHSSLHEAQLQRLTFPSRHLPPLYPVSALSIFCLDRFVALIHYLKISSSFSHFPFPPLLLCQAGLLRRIVQGGYKSSSGSMCVLSNEFINSHL